MKILCPINNRLVKEADILRVTIPNLCQKSLSALQLSKNALLSTEILHPTSSDNRSTTYEYT